MSDLELTRETTVGEIVDFVAEDSAEAPADGKDEGADDPKTEE